MMDDLEFEVEGNPEPWQVQVRNSARTDAYERRVAWQEQIRVAALQVWKVDGGHTEPFAGLFELQMVFYMPWPPNAQQPRNIPWPGNGSERIPGMDRLLGKKPDLTNLFKAAEDALKGIIIKDDCQRVAGGDRKVYDGRKVGGVKIWIKFLT